MGFDELDDNKEKGKRDVEALVAEANYTKWDARQKFANQGRGSGGDSRGGRGVGRGDYIENRGGKSD